MNDNKPPKNKEEQLFTRYLEICNAALETNKDAFPYKQLWESAQRELKDKTISLTVYDDHPKATFDVTMHDNHIDIISKRKTDRHAWHINLTYLEKVVSNPEEYINNPAKIDWDWITNRID